MSKIIEVLNGDEVVKTYETANTHYTDEQDVESAVFVAEIELLEYTSVRVNGRTFEVN